VIVIPEDRDGAIATTEPSDRWCEAGKAPLVERLRYPPTAMQGRCIVAEMHHEIRVRRFHAADYLPQESLGQRRLIVNVGDDCDRVTIEDRIETVHRNIEKCTAQVERCDENGMRGEHGPTEQCK
jgi:hypothetical protein